MNKGCRLAWMTFVAFGLFALVSPALAVPLTLNSVSAVWMGVGGADNVNGLGTNEVRWGTVATGDPQAGLRFDPAAPPPVPIAADSTFALGTFSHINFPTFGTAATGATLQLGLNITNGGSYTPTFMLNFAITETPNAVPCASFQVSGTPCDDRIAFPVALGGGSFVIDGVTYDLLLLGFGPSSASLGDAFITEEGRVNATTLWAELDSTGGPGAIPEPGTVTLLGLGLGALRLVRRRRQA